MSRDGSTVRTTTCEVTVDEDGSTAQSTPTACLEGQAARFSEWVAPLSEGTVREGANLVLSTLGDGLSMDPSKNPLSRRISVNRLILGTFLSMAFVWIQYDGSTGGLVALAITALGTVTAVYSTKTIDREHVESVEIDDADRELTITHETTPGILNFLGYEETESSWRLPDDASVEEARRAFEEYGGGRNRARNRDSRCERRSDGDRTGTRGAPPGAGDPGYPDRRSKRDRRARCRRPGDGGRVRRRLPGVVEQ